MADILQSIAEALDMAREIERQRGELVAEHHELHRIIEELVLILSNGELTVWQEPRKAALTLAHAVIANKLLAENQLHEARHQIAQLLKERARE